MKTIEKAIKIIGSQAEMGRKIGARADQVYKWLNNLQFPSIETALKIEEVTEGKVKAIDILNEKMEIKLNKMQKKGKK